MSTASRSDLVALCKMSRLMRNIATPLLYSVVKRSNARQLKAFLRTIKSPAASSRSLFLFVREFKITNADLVLTAFLDDLTAALLQLSRLYRLDILTLSVEFPRLLSVGYFPDLVSFRCIATCPGPTTLLADFVHRHPTLARLTLLQAKPLEQLDPDTTTLADSIGPTALVSFILRTAVVSVSLSISGAHCILGAVVAISMRTSAVLVEVVAHLPSARSVVVTKVTASPPLDRVVMHAQSVRTTVSKKSRHSRTLAAEIADATGPVDGDGDRQSGRGEYRSVTPSEEHATEAHLAAKWGLPQDAEPEMEGGRVTRRKRVTQVKRAPDAEVEPNSEDSRSPVDDFDGSDLSVLSESNGEQSIGTGVLTARGNLEDWQLPAVNQDAVQMYPTPRVHPYDIVDYFAEYPPLPYNSESESEKSESESSDEPTIVVKPLTTWKSDVSAWKSDWTPVTKNKAVKRTEVNKEETALMVMPKFFPHAFAEQGLQMDNEGQENNSDVPQMLNYTVPKLPEWKPMEFKVSVLGFFRGDKIHKALSKRECSLLQLGLITQIFRALLMGWIDGTPRQIGALAISPAKSDPPVVALHVVAGGIQASGRWVTSSCKFARTGEIFLENHVDNLSPPPEIRPWLLWDLHIRQRAPFLRPHHMLHKLLVRRKLHACVVHCKSPVRIEVVQPPGDEEEIQPSGAGHIRQRLNGARYLPRLFEELVNFKLAIHSGTIQPEVVFGKIGGSVPVCVNRFAGLSPSSNDLCYSFGILKTAAPMKNVLPVFYLAWTAILTGSLPRANTAATTVQYMKTALEHHRTKALGRTRVGRQTSASFSLLTGPTEQLWRQLQGIFEEESAGECFWELDKADLAVVKGKVGVLAQSVYVPLLTPSNQFAVALRDFAWGDQLPHREADDAAPSDDDDGFEPGVEGACDKSIAEETIEIGEAIAQLLDNKYAILRDLDIPLYRGSPVIATGETSAALAFVTARIERLDLDRHHWVDMHQFKFRCARAGLAYGAIWAMVAFLLGHEDGPTTTSVCFTVDPPRIAFGSTIVATAWADKTDIRRFRDRQLHRAFRGTRFQPEPLQHGQKRGHCAELPAFVPPNKPQVICQMADAFIEEAERAYFSRPGDVRSVGWTLAFDIRSLGYFEERIGIHWWKHALDATGFKEFRRRVLEGDGFKRGWRVGEDGVGERKRAEGEGGEGRGEEGEGERGERGGGWSGRWRVERAVEGGAGGGERGVESGAWGRRRGVESGAWGRRRGKERVWREGEGKEGEGGGKVEGVVERIGEGGSGGVVASRWEGDEDEKATIKMERDEREGKNQKRNGTQKKK
ncbi:hypothetical protein C8R45DRAFT_946624 [Mycena sanguinolenta]|nr:hypothetical protein C8R45DRAFT_946624 [Mycena sanguinolenta]